MGDSSLNKREESPISFPVAYLLHILKEVLMFFRASFESKKTVLLLVTTGLLRSSFFV